MNQKMAILEKVKQIYNQGGNIMQYLRDENTENSIEDIMISYDFQAGSYTKSYYEDPGFTNDFCNAFIQYVSSLGMIQSIFEAGVGEANRFVTILNKWETNFSFAGGVDLSWSRIKIGCEFASKELKKGQNINLVVGDMMQLPLLDDSVDLVYTMHALEPNGGREKELLAELYRVTKKYLVLVEPAYEFADEASKKRMDAHGYVKDIKGTAEKLGYKILLYEKFPIMENPMNPNEILIIEKDSRLSNHEDIPSPFCCPITKKELQMLGNAYYSEESCLAYPIMNGVPLLSKDHAVVAVKMKETTNT